MVTRFKTNVSEMEEDVETGEGGERRRVEWFKPNTGKNLLRILPPAAEGHKFYKRQGVHSIGSGMGKENKIVCPKLTFKKPCAVCSKYKKVLESKGEEAAEVYKPKKRYLLNVLDLKAGNGEVYVWEAGPQLFRPLYEFIKEMQDDSMLDYEEGYNYKFTRTGMKKNTRYTDAMVVPKVYNLAENGYDLEEVQGKLYDLDKVPWRSREEDILDFLERLNDYASGGSDDDDEDGGGRRRGRSGGGRGSSEVRDEDDDDDAPAARKGKGRRESDDDDEEEDERPAKAKKPKPADDDEEDDEEEEEERPKSKPKAKTGKKPKPADDDPADDDDIPF